MQGLSYLPKQWRRHFSEARINWGGRTDGSGVVTWWSVVGVSMLGPALLGLLRRRRRVVVRAVALGASAS